ncbi:hypothetical protein SO802_002603 [Lithocarpus litseifolius]|uniref:DUF4283 domain-containing protein n=1 Tax=Lithocarpus litseifolius TaxID=425828 RepID=A0AAW2E1G9_9ROSI
MRTPPTTRSSSTASTRTPPSKPLPPSSTSTTRSWIARQSPTASLLSVEDLTKSWSCLTLSDVEGSNLRITEEEVVTDFVLAAKFLTKRALNIDVIAKTFTLLWRSKNGFKVKQDGDHVVLFTFNNKEELDKILAAKPWSFDKHLMVLRRYNKDIDLFDMKFNLVTFWVQYTDQLRKQKLRGVALSGFELLLISLSHSVKGEYYLWRMERNYGCLSNMRASPTCAIGVVASHMMTEIAISRLKAKEHSHVNLSNLKPGFEHLLLFHLDEIQSRCPDSTAESPLEQNPMDSSPIPMDHRIQVDFSSHHPDIERRSVSAELFEDQIQELDRDISKFDSAPELSTENISCTGKCYFEDSSCLLPIPYLKDDAPRQSAPLRTFGWTPSREGSYKVNVDGAVFKETGSYGIGIVIRNERGLIMGAMSKKMDIPLGALEVEAKAFEEGILLAGNLGLKDIVLEGEVKVVTDALASSSSPPSSIQMIIEGFQG